MCKILKGKEVLQAPSTQNNSHAMWATCDKLKHGLNMTLFDVQYRAKLLPVCFAQIYADMQCFGTTDQGMVFSWRCRVATTPYISTLTDLAQNHGACEGVYYPGIEIL